MLKLLHLTHGKEYLVEVGMIALVMVRTDARRTYFNLVQEDYINHVRKVCVTFKPRFVCFLKTSKRAYIFICKKKNI